MSILLGVDTGGTYTDAVLIKDETTILASAKSLTTRNDLAVGVGNAVQSVLNDSGVAPSDIVMTSLSTTLATNALVEGKGGKVCLVFIGFSEKDVTRQGLDAALKGDPLIIIAGGHDHSGNEVTSLEEQALRDQLKVLEGVSGFAIAAQFSTRNASHEIRVRDIVRDVTSAPVTCSHELSAKLGGPKRAMTAVLNARLIGMIDHLVGATETHFKTIGITCPMMVVRGDGALISADQAREKPIETILSGPAASIVGARWLTDETDALVSDIGGTTTDVAILRNGRPMIDPDGAMVGGLRTMVEAVSMRTFGLGGDSQVHLSREGLAGEISLGPRRVMPVSLLATTHRDMVHDALDSALGDERGQEFAGQFLVPMVENSTGLSARDQAVFDRIVTGALPMAMAVKTRIDLGAIERLVEAGLVMQAGITPSDASHVLGRVDVWDRPAAYKALSVFGRMRTGAGEMLSDDPDDLAGRIIDQLTEQTAEVLLEAAFSDEGFDGRARDLARHILVKKGMSHHRGVVSLDVGLNLPVVGLGASAHAYYDAVGDRVNAQMILPQHGGVANAIGAVVGQITMRELGLIEGAGDGAWRVFGDDGPVVYNDQEEAYQTLRNALGSQAIIAAKQAGAADIQVRFEEDVQEATIEGRSVFVKGSVLAIASGRPRITV